jgi:DNA 3'-phosphatase
MWQTYGSVVYYISNEFKFTNKFAMFTFNETLIKSLTMVCDKYDSAIYKLNELHSNNINIIIYESITDNCGLYKKACEKFISKHQKIANNVLIFISTKKNKYAKPFTGIISLLDILACSQNIKIDISNSIYIGNNAGRITYNNKLIDKNCDDRSFAYNAGLTFYTPDRFFLNTGILSLWQADLHIPTIDERSLLLINNKSLIIPNLFDEIESLDTEFKKLSIIITGQLSSSKTTLSKKLIRKLEIEKLTHPVYNTYIPNDINYNNINIFDIKFDYSQIIKIIKASMTEKVKILLIDIDIPIKTAKLLNHIHIQKSTIVYQLYQDYMYDVYESKKNKLLDLGQIPCLRYVKFPLFIDASEAFWMMY